MKCFMFTNKSHRSSVLLIHLLLYLLIVNRRAVYHSLPIAAKKPRFVESYLIRFGKFKARGFQKYMSAKVPGSGGRRGGG